MNHIHKLGTDIRPVLPQEKVTTNVQLPQNIPITVQVPRNRDCLHSDMILFDEMATDFKLPKT